MMGDPSDLKVYSARGSAEVVETDYAPPKIQLRCDGGPCGLNLNKKGGKLQTL